MRITFLGDAMMQPEQLHLYEKDGKYDFSECFSALEKYLKSSDYVVANLETPIADPSDCGFTNKMYEFNTPLEFASSLKNVGINLVTTANNHCLDRGLQGLFSTVENLEGIGLECIGTRNRIGDSFIIKDIDGFKIGFLAFTYGTNAFANKNYLKEHEYQYVDMLQNQELSNQFDNDLLYSRKLKYKIIRGICRPLRLGQLDIAPYERHEKNRERLFYYKSQIEKCRRSGAEIIISLLHIGGQYNDAPSEYTKKMCSLSFDYGADIVVANHEHVIHGWKKDKRHFCEYSLGNLVAINGVIAEPFDKMAEYSMALNVDIDRDEIKYSFYLCHSVLREDEKIICIPVYDEWITADNETKTKLEMEVNSILRKLFKSNVQKYEILKEYSIVT